MAGQRGRDVLIKVSDGSIPEAFETLAGIRSTEIEMNAGSVDGTAADSPEGWRELGTVTGPFHIRELKWTGAFDTELGFSIDLESAGRLAFEALS